MAELLVVGFQDNIHRASGVLDELRVLDDKWILDLADAVALHRDVDGRLTMDQSYQPTGRNAAKWGSTLGLIIGATLLIPIANGANVFVSAGANAAVTSFGQKAGAAEFSGHASIWEDILGFPPESLEKAKQLIRHGNSAIYVILEAADPTPASARFEGYGGAVLHLSLSTPQQVIIERLLKDARRLH